MIEQMMNVVLLGTSGTLPLPGRNLASCYVTTEAGSILIDAGEGTQIAIQKFKKSAKNIDVILITHCHLDHLGGLPGILQAIANTKRRKPITLMGPVGIESKLIAALEFISELPFKIKVIEIDREHCTPLKFGNTEITPFPAEHTIMCFGYNITIARKRKFLVEKAQELSVEPAQYQELIDGKSIVTKAGIVSPLDVLGPERKGIKLSYCVDTRPTRKICEAVSGADLFICEGMYYEDSKQEKAYINKHLMWKEALSMAERAGVYKMWLTHFSPAIYTPRNKAVNLDTGNVEVVIGYDGLHDMLTYRVEE